MQLQQKIWRQQQEIKVMKQRDHHQRQQIQHQDHQLHRLHKETYTLWKKVGYVIIWQWRENDGTWRSYDHEISKIIERLRINNISL